MRSIGFQTNRNIYEGCLSSNACVRTSYRIVVDVCNCVVYKGNHSHEVVDLYTVNYYNFMSYLGRVHLPGPHGSGSATWYIIYYVYIYIYKSSTLDIVSFRDRGLYVEQRIFAMAIYVQ